MQTSRRGPVQLFGLLFLGEASLGGAKAATESGQGRNARPIRLVRPRPAGRAFDSVRGAPSEARSRSVGSVLPGTQSAPGSDSPLRWTELSEFARHARECLLETMSLPVFTVNTISIGSHAAF